MMHYNFVRIHKTLRVTPAMAAAVTDKLLEMSDMVKALEDWEAAKSILISIKAGQLGLKLDGLIDLSQMWPQRVGVSNCFELSIGGNNGTNPTLDCSGSAFRWRWFLYGPSVPLLWRGTRHYIGDCHYSASVEGLIVGEITALSRKSRLKKNLRHVLAGASLLIRQSYYVVLIPISN
jgi:hypothetical protein